ncbi:hypothetical protein GCM10011521_02430 [Arenimonas soli]|uniref:Uncharacterized protein n=1 Tax=Arenimonas soli TaxID=2269504 RepID=A0ABQ1HA86_9GAMM|nr:hypothetical protein GCM10011521_02430 [Arenimonas soli]
MRDLVARADGGDRRAACRLGSLLAHCRLINPDLLTDDFLAALHKNEDDMAARGELSAANEAASMILNLTTLRRQCDGIPPSLSRRAPAYLRQSALAGEPEAVVRYLRGDAFVGLGATDSSDLLGPDFDQWRREAPALLQAQLAIGRPEAALLLLEAHSHHGTTLSFITPEDPLRDQAYLRLAQRLFEDFELPDYWMTDEPGPDLARDADLLAREWQERFFQDRRFRISKDLVGLGNALLPEGDSTWPAAESWRPACAEPEDDFP